MASKWRRFNRLQTSRLACRPACSWPGQRIGHGPPRSGRAHTGVAETRRWRDPFQARRARFVLRLDAPIANCNHGACPALLRRRDAAGAGVTAWSSVLSETPEAKRPAPFSTLLAASSMVLAVLLVAGFSYRWAYYYNFGLKDLAIQAPVQALAISALELIRTPAEAWSTLLIVALPMFVLSFTIAALQRLGASSSQHSRLRALATWSVSSPLMLDSARAVVLLYTAYWAGSEAGLRKFLTHVVESPANSLPKVTVAGGGKTQDVSFPIACTPADWTGAAPGRSAVPPVVGSPAAVDAFRQGLACNAQGTRSWRLLYRDDRFIYLFATGAAEARPATVILPNNDSIVVILQGGGTP